MKNSPTFFGILAILLFLCIKAQSQNSNLSMADQLHQGRDTIQLLYWDAYKDILACIRKDAVFDTVCYISLSNRFTKTSQFLFQYSKILRQNEVPIWIDGKSYFLFVPFKTPSGEKMEEIADKFEQAAANVLVCVNSRAAGDTCRLVGPTVSDAVNSLARSMGWLN